MPARPEHLIEHPVERTGTEGADLLSRVLGQIRSAGERVVVRSLAADAVLAGPAVPEGCIIVPVSGEAIVREQRGVPLTVATGELLLLPEGMGEVRVQAGPGGAELLLCSFQFEAHVLRGSVLAIPAVIHITQSRGHPWLDGLVHFLRLEAEDDQPGAVLMVSRLVDLIVVRALRTLAHERGTPSWLGGLTDPRIASVLAALHADPLRRWTLKALAGTAGMSRSHFCERFVSLVGKSPSRYHADLRLGCAREMLRNGRRIGEVGYQIGYGSEAAFSRAYKARFGQSPVTERRTAGERQR